MVKFIYPALLLACVIFIFWKGRFEERVICATIVGGSIATGLIYNLWSKSWLQLSIPLLANELIATAIILTVAYRSKRFWPLPVAAFQLIALLSQVVSLVGKNLESYAVGVTQGMWAYLELAILVLATMHGMKQQRAIKQPKNL